MLAHLLTYLGHGSNVLDITTVTLLQVSNLQAMRTHWDGFFSC